MLVAIALLLLAPLANWCKEASCRNFEQSVAAVQGKASELWRRESRCFKAQQGRCGNWRYTSFGDGYTGFAEYFTESGQMVAARWWSDDGQPDRLFGEPISCKQERELDLCAAAREQLRHSGGTWQIQFGRLESMFTATNNPDGSVSIKAMAKAEAFEAWALRPPPELPVFVDGKAAARPPDQDWRPLAARVLVGNGEIRIGEVELVYTLQPDPQQGSYAIAKIPARARLESNGHSVAVADHFSATAETYFELFVNDALTAKFSLRYFPELR